MKNIEGVEESCDGQYDIRCGMKLTLHLLYDTDAAFDARFCVHFFLGSPDISYIISTDFDRNQLL